VSAVAAIVAPRRRTTIVWWLVATIALGLATRRVPDVFPVVVARYGGDALWATMVYWLVALVRPAASRRTLALIALLVAFGVEASQLLQTPWLEALRATRLGALALGQGFLASDLAAYCVGVLLALLLDVTVRRHPCMSPSV
jgi:hypothetical protein